MDTSAQYRSFCPGNGLLVASKYPFEIQEPLFDIYCPQRWLHARLVQNNLSILGVHIPGANDGWNKATFWKDVQQFANLMHDNPVVIIGDFNTGLPQDTQGAPFHTTGSLKAILAAGWVDAWRSLHPEEADFTWYSRTNNGYRLDDAFLSPKCHEWLLDAEHRHHFREANLSDHSALRVSLKSL